MKKRLHSTVILFALAIFCCFSNAYAQKNIVVATDGSGDFKSIQEAINSLPDSAKKQRVIIIKKGIYNEKLFITKNFITLKGEDPAQTKIVYSEARDIYRCLHQNEDWGVATINLKGSDIVMENLTVLNTYGFDANGDSTIACPADTVKKIKLIRKEGHQMALRSFNTTRLIVRNCVFRALGGDTVSPWNVDNGMFYFSDCTMEGGVDFYCPRGWSLAENCTFICHSKDAAIWHDGSKNKSSKTVLINCTFKGDDGFKLGRYHREAQFYLIDCTFPTNMADADIYQREANPPNILQWGKRVYYYNCHRIGGDYSWHKNNFPDSLGVNDITQAWAYDYKWNPRPDPSASMDKIVNTKGDDFVADNMLLYQRKNGGWPKHFQELRVDYNKQLTDSQKAELKAGYEGGIDATIDNNATYKEINYLVKAYKQTQNKKYLTGAEKGVDYLLTAQYANGGWPQFYPDFSNYRSEITYNDNAMINVLNILQDIIERKNGFDVINITYIPKCRVAVKNGIDCILKTQVKQGDKRTVWCAQYDAKTLEPAKARAYELPSLSGEESVDIVRFLMRLKKPSAEIVDAVQSAVDWFKAVKIIGYKFIEIKAPQEQTGRDKILVPADSSSVLWARFYDLQDNEPFFCGRDGIRKKTLAEVENERRAGYQWYGNWPQKLIDKEYNNWNKNIKTAGVGSTKNHSPIKTT